MIFFFSRQEFRRRKNKQTIKRHLGVHLPRDHGCVVERSGISDGPRRRSKGIQTMDLSVCRLGTVMGTIAGYLS